MKKVLVSIVAMLAVVTAAHATLTYSVVGAPTTPGGAFPPPVPCMTYQLTVTEDSGNWPIGISIAIGDPSPGPYTLINQVNPMGQPTIYADNNPFITGMGGFIDQDSQFPYISAAGATQQVIPTAASSESSTLLYGDWAYFGGTLAPNVVAGPSMLVAQVVIPVGTQVPFSSTVVEYDPINFPNGPAAAVINLSGIIPEPATLALLAIGGLGALLRRKR